MLLKYLHPLVSAVPALSNPDSEFDSHRGEASFQLAQCGNTGGNTQSNMSKNNKTPELKTTATRRYLCFIRTVFLASIFCSVYSAVCWWLCPTILAALSVILCRYGKNLSKLSYQISGPPRKGGGGVATCPGPPSSLGLLHKAFF